MTQLQTTETHTQKTEGTVSHVDLKTHWARVLFALFLLLLLLCLYHKIEIIAVIW